MTAGAGLVEVARGAATLASRHGAREAAASAYRSRRVEVEWRDGALERVTEATTRGLGLDLFVDGRYSSLSTSDLRPQALERFVQDGVALTRTLEPDPHRFLPDPALYAGQAKLDLDLEDPAHAGLDGPVRRQMAQAAEVAARSVAGSEAILSVSTGAGDTLTETFLVHTNGFEGSTRSTNFGLAAQVSVKDPDGRRPEDHAFCSARHRSALESPEAVGRSAAERALRRIGSSKGESAVVTVAVENRAAGRLLSLLLAPLSGRALQQKQSFLDGREGKAVGSARLDLADDPLIVRGLGSRLFDREGMAARRFPVFEGGVLRSFYLDSYYARKLGRAPTTGGMSNLAWKPGDEDQAALLRDIGAGILITGFLGGNSNSTTGDFSLGVLGFRVRGGEATEPVAEMNVSGNHLELWPRLAAVGNDPYPWSAMRTPTLVFEGVQVAGV